MKKTIKEKQPIFKEFFGLSDTVRNVITAVALSELSTDEMVAGFSQLAEYVAGRIAEKIQSDFIKAHTS